jgi:cell division protein FtsB
MRPSAHTKKNKHLISQTLGSLLCFGLFFYFAFHLLHGDMGYFALRGLNQKLAKAENRRDTIKGERVALENRVRLLRSNSLDLDMLDERAREVLGFVAPGEVVVLNRTP